MANFLSGLFGTKKDQPIDVGGSTTGRAAMDLRYQPIWTAAVSNGETDLDYEPWLAKYLGKNAAPKNSLAP
jgi:hypothetical protein